MVEWRGRVEPTEGFATPEQLVLVVQKRKQGKQTGKQRLSMVSISFLPPGSCSDLHSWLHAARQNKFCPPPVALGHYIFIQQQGLTRRVGNLLLLFFFIAKYLLSIYIYAHRPLLLWTLIIETNFCEGQRLMKRFRNWWHLYQPSSPRLRGHHRRGGRRVLWNATFQTWCGYCTHEVTAANVTCAKPHKRWS